MDIIIPVLNEERLLRERSAYFERLAGCARLVFVDGGSEDATVAWAKRWGQVMVSPCGRGIQKNAGARVAREEVILFSHVDTCLPLSSLATVEETLRAQGGQAVCFSLKVDDPAGLFRFFAAVVTARARWRGILDGDLGMAIRRSDFWEAGGFPNWPYMEDIRFSYQWRKRSGRVQVLPDPVEVSSRKWKEQGFWRTFGRYSAAYVRLWAHRPLHAQRSVPTREQEVSL